MISCALIRKYHFSLAGIILNTCSNSSQAILLVSITDFIHKTSRQALTFRSFFINDCMFVQGIPSSADLYVVDFNGEIVIDCSTLAQDSLCVIGLPERYASFILSVLNNFLSQFDIALRVGGFFLNLFLNLLLILSRISPVLWHSCTRTLVTICSSRVYGLSYAILLSFINSYTGIYKNFLQKQ